MENAPAVPEVGTWRRLVLEAVRTARDPVQRDLVWSQACALVRQYPRCRDSRQAWLEASRARAACTPAWRRACSAVWPRRWAALSGPGFVGGWRERWLSAFPGWAGGWRALAQVARRKGWADLEEWSLSVLTERIPGDGAAWAARVEALRRLGDRPGALAAAQAWAGKMPSDPRAGEAVRACAVALALADGGWSAQA